MRTIFTSMLAMAALVAALWVSPVQAALTGTVTVTVTMGNTGLSVEVTSGSPVGFGSVVASSTTVSGVAVVVTNNSSDTPTTYSLDATAAAGWTQGAPGANQYQLSAMFSTAAQAAGTFGAEDALTTTPTPCSATVFGNGTAGQSGLNVGTSAARNLWFMFAAPTSTTTYAAKSITVTITAEA